MGRRTLAVDHHRLGDGDRCRPCQRAADASRRRARDVRDGARSATAGGACQGAPGVWHTLRRHARDGCDLDRRCARHAQPPGRPHRRGELRCAERIPAAACFGYRAVLGGAAHGPLAGPPGCADLHAQPRGRPHRRGELRCAEWIPAAACFGYRAVLGEAAHGPLAGPPGCAARGNRRGPRRAVGHEFTGDDARTNLAWHWAGIRRAVAQTPAHRTDTVIQEATMNALSGLTLRERDARVIANIARLRFSPLSLVGGRGNRLIEEGGRELLDLGASFGPTIVGHSHSAIIAAVNAAVSNMAGASLLAFPNDNAVALAEQLLAITPGQGERRVWFGHSGSDANDCALRVVQAAPGRSRFISFIGSYHGNLSGSMSVSGHTAMTHTLPRAGLVLLPYPEPYRPSFSPEQVLNLLDYQFATTCPPQQVAGIFIEPRS